MALDPSPRLTLHNADCLDVLATLPDASVDAIITDPPYFNARPDHWDRQWPNADAFARWLGDVLDQFARVLRPAGSLYLFASPRMSSRVEGLIGERFRVLNHVVWVKTTGVHQKACRAAQRSYHPQTERIVFAEHYGAEHAAAAAAGYARQCATLRGQVFEPLRAYLDGERQRAGWSGAEIDAAWRAWRGKSGGGMAGHWFGRSQWALPTRENYEWLQRLLNSRTPGVLAAPHAVLAEDYVHLHARYDVLRRDYDTLKAEYAALRRPFQLAAEAPNTDVWIFNPTPARPGRHPCEKPLPLMRHIVRTSTRPGQVVLDAFLGSGSTGVAALEAGCDFIGIEQDAAIFAAARDRLTRRQPST
ncbi:DNA-methyltransferase [Chitinimonas koreensis]|uniref:DNA-methyltransferase n=1 Tax=Chitinimonas koreensis TaxID=356302 RepID=UPI0004045A7F|nr:site-specific DNA-methyltransferase [Chitinimonas koreensis]QNM96400.1 site-specific DNA-methyltransferase [Chitinimonas koreensis]